MFEKKVIEKIIRKAKTRQRVTEKTKEEIQEILDWISSLFEDDKITGYSSDTMFLVKYSYWNGRNWIYIKTDCVFGLINGKADILKEHYKDRIEVEVKELDYLELSACLESLAEFLIKLSKLKTFKEESKKLTEVLKVIKEADKDE